MFHLHGQKSPCITYRGLDLQPISDNTRISEQSRHRFTVKTGNLFRVKIIVCLAVSHSLFQDGVPA